MIQFAWSSNRPRPCAYANQFTFCVCCWYTIWSKIRCGNRVWALTESKESHLSLPFQGLADTELHLWGNIWAVSHPVPLGARDETLNAVSRKHNLIFYNSSRLSAKVNRCITGKKCTEHNPHAERPTVLTALLKCTSAEDTELRPKSFLTKIGWFDHMRTQ